jgi:hypothetical protein
MASSSKQRTTMAKRNRENAVRERQVRKAARKDARKRAAAEAASEPSDDAATDVTPEVDDLPADTAR